MTIPPASLEELRQLYIKIINGTHEIRLSGRAQAVLKQMLDTTAETASKSISEIAKENNINIPSVIRLA